MRALVVTSTGGPEVLEVRQEAEPRAGEVERLVQVRAAGLNFADILSLRGSYPGVPQPPFIAGREFAGVAEDSGEAVMGYAQWGAFADKVAGRGAMLWPKPEGFSFSEAAAFPVNFFTAYLAYMTAGLVRSSGVIWAQSDQPKRAALSQGNGSRVLIHAVAGGVGTAAVQIGKALGVETFGTSSSDEKLARARELGLDHGINYNRDDYEEAVRDLTGGEGVDAVFEMLGGEHTAKSERCLGWFGRVICYGTATGKTPQVDVRALYKRSTSVHGLWLSRLAERAEVMSPAWKQLSAWIAEGRLRPVVGSVLPLESGPEAYRLMDERKNVGKVVLEL